MRFPWLETALAVYLAALLAPLVFVAVVQLRKLYRARRDDRERHDAWMDGLAEGAGYDERDRREALRRRLRLE